MIPVVSPSTESQPTKLENQLARLVVMRAAEPQDHTVQHMIAAIGVGETALLLQGRLALDSGRKERLVAESVLDPDAYLHRVEERIPLWGKRVQNYNPQDELHFASKIGAWLLTPEEADWPSSLNDFGFNAPYGLWGRGDRERLNSYRESRSLAVVGSRDISPYGKSVTQHIAGDLAASGLTVVSGGAFGIDAEAHISALTTGISDLPTIAFMAGGVDRLYPKHNEKLLHQVIDQGLVFSEVPMGQAPTRWRFLHRNRLIAGVSRASIIVEARWRSGALNTANHALELGRTVYAVPGSVFSPSSEGCHRLVKDGLATLLTDPSSLIQELAYPMAEQTTAFPLENAPHPAETLNSTEKLIWDSLPIRRTMGTEELCATSGLPTKTVMIALSRLAGCGMAVQDSTTLQWKKKILKHSH